jgi:hypothetical protein
MSCPENTLGCPEESSNSTPTPTPVQFDASQIFYHSSCDVGDSNLTCMDLNNGVSLESFMETVDAKLCETAAFNFSTFGMTCLKERYTINTMAQFVAAMNGESCRLDTAYQNIANVNESLDTLSTVVNNILHPGLMNNCNIGFTSATPLVSALQMFVTHYCNFISSLTIPVSPAIVGINNSTIAWSNAGVLDHTLTASVKVSQDNNNVIEIRPDGLYATIPGVGPVWQTLNWDANTSELSISNGNTVTINFPGAQVLSLNNSILTLSGGGGSVNLGTIVAPAFTETVLSVTSVNAGIAIGQSGTSMHNLELHLKKDILTGGNILMINSDGLYVPPIQAWNGITASGPTLVELGGSLNQQTIIDLDSNELLLSDDNLAFSFKNDKFEIYKPQFPFLSDQFLLSNEIWVQRSGIHGMNNTYDYSKLYTYNGTTQVVPRMFFGVADTNDDIGNGSRTNIDSSLGFKVATSNGSAYTLNENHLMYCYTGNPTTPGILLTLPNAITSTDILGDPTISWIFIIKNLSSVPMDDITFSQDIYIDDATIVTALSGTGVLWIAAINGKWVKIN